MSAHLPLPAATPLAPRAGVAVAAQSVDATGADTEAQVTRAAHFSNECPCERDNLRIAPECAAAGCCAREEYENAPALKEMMHAISKPAPDPRDPDPSRSGIFVHHNCWKCLDGKVPCATGDPSQCKYPHARND